MIGKTGEYIQKQEPYDFPKDGHEY